MQHPRVARRIGTAVARVWRRVSLSQRFFLVALAVVLAAMLALGNWTNAYISQSITRGVAETAAASFEALISQSLDGAMSAADSQGGWLRLEVTDSTTIRRSDTSSADQVGLRAMRFRVESQGGTLSVNIDAHQARVGADIPIGRMV